MPYCTLAPAQTGPAHGHFTVDPPKCLNISKIGTRRYIGFCMEDCMTYVLFADNLQDAALNPRAWDIAGGPCP